MAAPNIIAATSVLGKTATVDLTTTSATEVLSNADSSGKVFKVNTLIVANVDGTNAADITVAVYSEDNIGGTPIDIVQSKAVAAKTNLVVISRDTPIYLEEDRSIGATASAGGDLQIVASYEEIG
jgi:hypothetical protein